jgi:hypothetical protein
MERKMIAAAIALGLFMLVSSCTAANLSNSENSLALLNSTVNTTNSTNDTVNLTNISINSTNRTVNSTNSSLETAIIDSNAKKSGLWAWGDAPKGYVRGADNSLVPEAYLDAQGSVMETPSEAVSNNNAVNQPGGLLVRPT